MGAKMPESVVDEAVKLISEQGMNCREASKILGYNEALISKRVKERGVIVVRNSGGKNRKKLPDSEIVSLYVGGMSEFELAEKYKTSRDSIRLRLKEASVHRRSQSEASHLSASRATIDQRKERARAANDSLRGTKQPVSGRVKRALTLENNPYEHMVGYGEIEMKDRMIKEAIHHEWQKAMHIYSLDFKIGGVALELKAGTSARGSKDVSNGRIKYLRDNNIFTIYVVFDSVYSLMESFEYIIGLVIESNLNQPHKGEYWVITCRERRSIAERKNNWKYLSNPRNKEIINRLIKRIY